MQGSEVLHLLKFVVHGVPDDTLLIESHTEMQLLTLRVRLHELDDKLTPLVLETTRCHHNHMAGTEEYGLIVAEGLVIVRGMYGRPWIRKNSAMIDLFDNLYLIAYLDCAYRSQRHAILEFTKLATIDRNVERIFACQDIDHKELPANNRIGQRYVVHHLGFLLAPHSIDASITHDDIVAKVT